MEIRPSRKKYNKNEWNVLATIGSGLAVKQYFTCKLFCHQRVRTGDFALTTIDSFRRAQERDYSVRNCGTTPMLAHHAKRDLLYSL